MDRNEGRKAIRNVIEAHAEELISIGDHIWKNPEPGYREVKTSDFVAHELEKLGLTVKRNLAVTGLRADIDTGKEGPTLAILGELDSLILPNHPECDKTTGAVHSCGHNASATNLIGTAIGLIKSGVLENMCGRIALIATPAEEGIEMDYRKSLIEQGKIGSIAGKSQMLREGVFDDVDLSYMHHLSSIWGYKDHNGCVNKKIIFHGKSCHAARPQNGKNALNAATLALNAIAMLREYYCNDENIRIHGIISNGGDSINIIPDNVTMEYMLRAPSLEKILSLNDRFDNAVLHAAKAVECEATVETLNGYMPLIDDPLLGKFMGKIAEELFPGITYDYNSTFLASCTDMGDIATVIPAIHGYTPGGAGTSHGIDYYISDKDSAYVKSSLLSATAAMELLYGDGAPAREIAAGKKDLLPIPEYIKIIDKINQVKSSQEL